MSSAIRQDKKKLILSALREIPFEGWTNKMVIKIFQQNDLDHHLAGVYFPQGYVEIFKEITAYIDELMLAAIDFEHLKTLKVREKVYYLIKTRIIIASEYKEVLKTGISLFVMPNNLTEGFKLLWHSADNIWQILGDKSLDFNYYSKRSLLAYVYFSTIMYWLEDQSEANYLTWRFLASKIEQVLQIGKVKNNLSDALDKIRISKIPVLRYLWAKYKSS